MGITVRKLRVRNAKEFVQINQYTKKLRFKPSFVWLYQAGVSTCVGICPFESNEIVKGKHSVL